MLLTMNAIIKYVLLHDKDLVEFQDIDWKNKISPSKHRTCTRYKS